MSQTLYWVGGNNNNDAGTPTNWQPQSVPAPGDYLMMNALDNPDDPRGDTMNVNGNELQADSLTMGDSATVNVSGIAGFGLHNLSSNGLNIVNLADNSEWIGGGTIGYRTGPTFINGPGAFANTGLSIFQADVTIGANVTGTGNTDVTYGGSLQFQGAVPDTQTVSLRGESPRSPGQGPEVNSLIKLSLTSPSQFNASVNMSFGEISLYGVQADAYLDFANTLYLFSGNSVVDTLKLTNRPDVTGALNPIQVHQTAFGVNVENAPGAYSDGGTLVPVSTVTFTPAPI
ncbi:MAG: hypothetical protein JO191_12045, partial [Mycobacteriaceae bacterium]|nr:hypothetical protein [Mycobacteriaceae bacterium]